jgi:hypothetical protein
LKNKGCGDVYSTLDLIFSLIEGCCNDLIHHGRATGKKTGTDPDMDPARQRGAEPSAASYKR